MLRCSQVEAWAATLTREGASGRAKEGGKILRRPVAIESATTPTPALRDICSWKSEVAGSSKVASRSATLTDNRLAIESSSAEAVRAALDSRSETWRNSSRTWSRLSPRLADTAITRTLSSPSASSSARTSSIRAWVPPAGRVSIWLISTTMSSWRAPRPRR